MNLASDAVSSQVWQRCTPVYSNSLPVLDFPFEVSPEIYSPANIVLRLGEEVVHLHLWCYLKRKVGSNNRSVFDVSSLSTARVNALPVVLVLLSKWFRFRNTRPRSAVKQLRALGALLAWSDAPENADRFETLLSDSDIALQALKGYHSYLRGKLQSHQLASATAAALDQDAIACLSEIHGRIYKDDIEPLSYFAQQSTKAPTSQDVQTFASMLQAIFDSAAALVLRVTPTRQQLEGPTNVRQLRLSASDDSQVVMLGPGYSTLRLMDLACVAFAGLSFVDSGANLAVLQQFEEPDDLHEQLAQPDRITLTQKAVKFRAGGKVVEVHLSATTMTRLPTYLRVRQALVDALDGDIAQMFIHCTYQDPRSEPTGIRPLGKEFLTCLRKRVKAAGASLPGLTLRQLRAFKQQDLVKRAPVAVAAKLMGHSVKTATRAYCNSQEGVRQVELASFLDALQKTVLDTPVESAGRPLVKLTPAGACADYGKPTLNGATAVVEPDCRKTEGCFFCDNYRVHADEQDLRKLMSCRRVLRQIVPLNGDSVLAEKTYTAVVDRIEALLGELKRRKPEVYEAVRVDVEERGQLTAYWARKVQQLHLLGMLSTA